MQKLKPGETTVQENSTSITGWVVYIVDAHDSGKHILSLWDKMDYGFTKIPWFSDSSVSPRQG